MIRSQQPALTPFAIGMIGLGILALVYGDFALVWQPVVLFSIFPRLAGIAEAVMISLFTILVWGPAILTAPRTRLPWTAFFISSHTKRRSEERH